MSRRVEITKAQIEAWIARNFEYKRKSNGRQLIISNPFDNDTGRHFWISTEKIKSKKHGKEGYWVHDFRTDQYNMSFLSFVKRFRRISYFAALAEVTGQQRSTLKESLRQSRARDQEQEEEPEQTEYIALPEYSKPIAEGGGKAYELAVNYLNNRKVTLEQAKEHNIHYTPTTLVFPYIEYGDLVYWQEREMIQKRFNFPDEAKTGLGKTDFFYNYDNVEQPGSCIVAVESIFNCINMGDDCLASGGAIIPKGSKQEEKIRGMEPRMIVLAPDNDKAGINSLLDNLLVFAKICEVGYCLPPTGVEDWNDLEKRDGHGAARRYILNYSSRLEISTAMRLRERI